MNKENSHAIVRPSASISSKGRTPPRLRSSNSINCANNNNEVGEDFSFAKLRGAVQNFEQKQKHHLSKTKTLQDKTLSLNTNTSVPIPSCPPPYKMITPPASTSMRKQPQTDFVRKSKTIGASTYQPLSEKKAAKSNSPTSHVPSNDEDFSFQKLQQRAFKMEERNPLSCTKNKKETRDTEEEEDFSFQKLKEKALGQEKQKKPIRSSPKTPNKTPLSLPKPMTPSQNTGIVKPKQFTPTTHTEKAKLARGSSAKTTTFNPQKYRFGTKVKKEEVQATDETHASVQKLSHWLSDDPFDKKKTIVVRKGMNIIQKSRAFEQNQVSKLVDSVQNKNMSRVERERQHFPQGKVSQGKSWLKSAFGEDKKDSEDDAGGDEDFSFQKLKQMAIGNEQKCLKSGNGPILNKK